MLIVIKDKFDVTGIRGEVLRRRIVHETRLELICFSRQKLESVNREISVT